MWQDLDESPIKTNSLPRIGGLQFSTLFQIDYRSFLSLSPRPPPLCEARVSDISLLCRSSLHSDHFCFCSSSFSFHFQDAGPSPKWPQARALSFFIHTHAPTHSLTHSFTHSLTHSLTHSHHTTLFQYCISTHSLSRTTQHNFVSHYALIKYCVSTHSLSHHHVLGLVCNN